MVVRIQSLIEPRSEIHITYPLPEIIFIAYISILSGHTKWKSMEWFAKYNQSWFRQFFPYTYGFPSHDTIATVFKLIDPEAFSQLFVEWVRDTVAEMNALKMGPHPEKNDNVIAIDGKALRGSRPSKGKKLVHIVSAYSSELKLILGFTPVDMKSNEITAIPDVIDTLFVEGALITSDAMGCQKTICKKIIEKKADYLLCAKENQPTLSSNIEACFTQYLENHQKDPKPEDNNPAFAETIEKNKGRQEHRRCWVFNNVADIDPKQEWPGLQQFSVIQRDRLIGKKQTTELHFYIESREMTAASVLSAARNHWSTENGQHLSLDVSFREDASKIHERTAAKNIATVRRWCFNAHKKSCRFEKESMASRIELAGLDADYRTELVLETLRPD
nr:ISAs1 family transposase [Endozoicomonas ascidiicola]